MPNEHEGMETALHEWVTAIDAVSELIFMHDAEGRILRANRAYAVRAGIDLKQLKGLFYWEVFPKMPGPCPLCPTKLDAGGLLIKEVVLDSGETFVSHGYPIVTSRDGYRYSVHVLHDVTETKRLEAERQAHIAALTRFNAELAALNSKLGDAQSQLVQSEKLASIGQLAAGVAHEINNPIGFVHSNLRTLDSYVKNLFALIAVYEQLEAMPAQPDEALARIRAMKAEMDLVFVKDDLPFLIAESNQGINRVTKIVQDLKDFSHVDREEIWALEDLHQGLDSTINVVWNELKYKCELKKEYGDLPPVECLQSQLKQVFMNLLVNAAHAIENKGAITLRSGVQDDQVWLEVSDTGQGIAPENIERIFDPFFTTKPVGKGTGLGLSVSYSIIKKHHGRIEVDSQLGIGTTFRIWLPLRQPDSSASSLGAEEAVGTAHIPTSTDGYVEGLS